MAPFSRESFLARICCSSLVLVRKLVGKEMLRWRLSHEKLFGDDLLTRR